MKVVHLCTHMDGGGAFQGMLNLHRGLIASGVESRILARDQDRQVPFGTSWDPDPWGKGYLRHISLKKIWSNRTRISNTHFSLDYLGVEVCNHPWVQEADILHLHWVADYLSSHSIARLAELKKPMLWTLHDIRPLTGGCHYPAGCKKYATGCNQCPQLIRNFPPITAHAWQALRRSLAGANIEWIGPSRWICHMAQLAHVAEVDRIHHLPYGIEKPNIKGSLKAKARKRLGLSLKKTYILVTASFLKEQRKGTDLAKRILEISRQRSPNFNPSILIVGNDSDSLILDGLEIYSLGNLNRKKMEDVLSAADLLLFTALEDNLPFILIEALCFGLVPVASSVGGVTDLLPKNQFSNLLFKTDSPWEGADKVLRLLGSKKYYNRLRKKVIQRAKTIHTTNQQALAHISIYKKSLKRIKKPLRSVAGLTGREGGAVSFPISDFFIRLGWGRFAHILTHWKQPVLWKRPLSAPFVSKG